MCVCLHWLEELPSWLPQDHVNDVFMHSESHTTSCVLKNQRFCRSLKGISSRNVESTFRQLSKGIILTKKFSVSKIVSSDTLSYNKFGSWNLLSSLICFFLICSFMLALWFRKAVNIYKLVLSLGTCNYIINYKYIIILCSNILKTMLCNVQV